MPKRLQNPLDPHLIDRELERARQALDDFRPRYRWLFDMAYYKRKGGSEKVSGTRELTDVEIVAETDPTDSVYPRRRKKLARALMKLERATMDLESAVGEMEEGRPGMADSSGRLLSQREFNRLKTEQAKRVADGGGFGRS